MHGRIDQSNEVELKLWHIDGQLSFGICSIEDILCPRLRHSSSHRSLAGPKVRNIKRFIVAGRVPLHEDVVTLVAGSEHHLSLDANHAGTLEWGTFATTSQKSGWRPRWASAIRPSHKD